MGSQIAQRTQIYFQSPAEIKEMSLKVTQISQIFTDKFFLEHEICRIPTSARSNYHELTTN